MNTVDFVDNINATSICKVPFVGGEFTFQLIPVKLTNIATNFGLMALVFCFHSNIASPLPPNDIISGLAVILRSPCLRAVPNQVLTVPRSHGSHCEHLDAQATRTQITLRRSV